MYLNIYEYNYKHNTYLNIYVENMISASLFEPWVIKISNWHLQVNKSKTKFQAPFSLSIKLFNLKPFPSQLMTTQFSQLLRSNPWSHRWFLFFLRPHTSKQLEILLYLNSKHIPKWRSDRIWRFPTYSKSKKWLSIDSNNTKKILRIMCLLYVM